MSDRDYVRRSAWLLVVFGVVIMSLFSSLFSCLYGRQCFQHYRSSYCIFYDAVVANSSICRGSNYKFSVAAHFRVVEMLLLVGQSVGDTATWSTKLLPFWDLYKKETL
jgi:hypothetical protein